MDEHTNVPPLTWTSTPENESNLKKVLIQWKNNHPATRADGKMIVITRTIIDRILGNLENSNLAAYDPQEVRYETVFCTLRREQNIWEDQVDEWVDALANAWEMFTMVLSLGFTKPDNSPDDD